MKREINVWLLSLVSLLNDISSKIVFPLLPLFIVSLGGGGIVIGLVSGLSEAIAASFTMLSGYWSDKWKKRKVFVVVGYIISTVSRFGLAFSKLVGQILIFRSVERLGKGIREAPRDALLASAVKKRKRGKYFGIHRAFDSGGAIIGSILALVFFWFWGWEFKELFMLAGVIGLFSLLPLILVKERKEIKKKLNLKVGWKQLNKQLKWFFFISGLFALGNFSYMFFVLKVQDFMTGSLIIGGPIIFYIIYELAYTLFSVPAGILSDKIGRGKVLMLGYGMFVFVCLGFMFLSSIWQFVILFVLYGLMYAFVNATERAYISDLSSEEIRGTALGTYYLFTSLAVLPGGLMAGLLWDANKNLTFGYGLVIALLVVGMFWLHRKKKNKKK